MLKEMCNLSQGILERGIAQGIERGRIENQRTTAFKMYENDLPLEMIAEITELSIEEIKELIKKS